MAKSWTKQKVLDEIQALHKTEGKIYSLYVRTHHYDLLNAAICYWGSWKKAVTAAGFNYADIKKKGGTPLIWTPERIIARILEIYQTEGRVNCQFVYSRWPTIVTSANKQFGTYGAAVEAAGLSYNTVRLRQSWNKKKIVAEIRRRYRCDLSINHSSVQKEDASLTSAASLHFGKHAWSKALRFAGFDPIKVNKVLVWSKGKILREILRLHRLGSPLNQTFIQENRQDLFSATRKRFNSWPKAIRAAGLDYKKIRLTRQWSRRTVIIEIRKLEKSGVRLNPKTVCQRNSALVATASVIFGCWSQAVEAAGIDYSKHCKMWSTKAWLRKLTPSDVVRLKHRADVLTRMKKSMKGNHNE